MAEKRRKEMDSQYRHSYSAKEDYLASCSSTDMTGLIPAGPIDEEQWERYSDLYPSLTPPVLLEKDQKNSENRK